VCVEEDYRTVPPSVEYECVGMCFGGWRSSEYDDDVVQTSEGGLLRKSAAMTSSNDQSTQHGSHTIKQSVFRPRRSGWMCGCVVDAVPVRCRFSAKRAIRSGYRFALVIVVFSYILWFLSISNLT